MALPIRRVHTNNWIRPEHILFSYYRNPFIFLSYVNEIQLSKNSNAISQVSQVLLLVGVICSCNCLGGC